MHQWQLFLLFSIFAVRARPVPINANDRRVHIATQWSPHQQPLFDLWSTTIASAMERDGSPASTPNLYTLHCEYYSLDANASGTGVCCDDKWKGAVRRKIGMLHELAVLLPAGSTIAFSDVDIIFFTQRLSKVFDLHRASGNAITFQRRWRGHPGVNTGFFVVTVSTETRAFLALWHSQIEFNDQDVVNRWAMRWGLFGYSKSPSPVCDGGKECPEDRVGLSELRLGTFPDTLAVTKVSELSKSAALFHVVGRVHAHANLTGTESKLERLKNAIAQKPAWGNRTVLTEKVRSKNPS